MVRTSLQIRRLVVDSGLVSDEGWANARSTGKPVLDVLIESGEVEEALLYEVLAATSGIVPIDLTRVNPDDESLAALSQEACMEHCVLPIAKLGDHLTVAVFDPFDVFLIDDLTIKSGCKVRAVLSHPAAIRAAHERIFQRGQREVDELIGDVNGDELLVAESDQPEDLDATVAEGEDAPAVKLVNLMILRALREKASDIHVEPMDKCLRVRFRVDGRLSEAMSPPKQMMSAILSRLKILANLDIAIRMEPQDGKFQMGFEGRRVDFRLSTLPVVGGEKAVMRILDQSGVAPNLEGLNFEPRCLQDFKEGTQASYGMLLVTGPTGSGKSTTLYAAVREVATPEVNVVTVEDPVEYRMDGINQVPVNPKRGLTFAGALRSILRQDPDVVLIGEIRDKETAEIAIKAALTGHLVLSTLHTNSAVQAVTRLMDMGIDPFMVSSAVVMVAAQRLVRQLCPHCKEEVDLPEKELLHMGFRPEDLEGELSFFGPHKEGCPRCKNGYRGRMALLETFPNTPEIKRMVVAGASADELQEKALEQGMVTLRRAGLLNATRGKTSLEEVLRIT
jgi:type IV pilus assembly protein PilB